MNDQNEVQQYSTMLNDFAIDIKDFISEKLLSTNNLSTVNLIRNKKTGTVCVSKTIFKQGIEVNIKDENKFLFLTSQFQHPTIIKFIGFSKIDFNGKNNLTIFMKHATNGSLCNMIQKYHKNPNLFDQYNRTASIILIGISRGMLLLHKHNIIHGNLKPSNILLNEKFYPLISDFKYANETVINVSYIAPEILLYEKITEKSDVFSFGMIMYLIISGGIDPYPANLPIKAIMNIVEGVHPQFNFPIHQPLAQLIQRCWQNDPNQRPSFEEIFNELAYNIDYYFNDVNYEDIEEYMNLIKEDLIFCTVCQKIIDKNDLLYYSGNPYHKKCVKCMHCQKTADLNADLDFFCITKSLFLCKPHYEEYINKNIKPNDQYKKICLKNLIDEKLNQKWIGSDDILKYPPQEVFIDNNMLHDSFQVDRPYNAFIPTAKFHFDKTPEKVDFKELQKLLLNSNTTIINVETGSTFIIIAFILTGEFMHLEEKYHQYIDDLKDKFNSELGKSIIGNFIGDPEFSEPDKFEAEQLINKKSINILQNTIELNQIDMDYLFKEASLLLSKESNYKDWSYIFSNAELFEEAEKQIHKDIQDNAFEMIITGHTIIANKYLSKYNKIKAKIPQNDVYECFLYHGSRLNNHTKIIKNHFLMPGKDVMKEQTDNGYYGKGIYATENMFYASIYGNEYKVLGYYEKTSIICCRVIYNKSKIKNINNLRYLGKKISDDIAANYGVHHAFVGNAKEFQPIVESEKDKNIIIGHEYVISNKYQIIPFYSFTLMRMDYFILWKDENIDNNENSNYMKKLSKKIEQNIYFKKSVDDALELIQNKKYNKIKLITNGGRNLSGKKLIEEARKIIGSNFVCLVFASDVRHMEWISKIENVLFTSHPKYFKKFAELKMTKNDVLNFIKDLETRYDFHFKINENELLNFPLADKACSKLNLI